MTRIGKVRYVCTCVMDPRINRWFEKEEREGRGEKEEGRRKRREGRGEKEEGRRKKDFISCMGIHHFGYLGDGGIELGLGLRR